jgi:hypothetical protein
MYVIKGTYILLTHCYVCFTFHCIGIKYYFGHKLKVFSNSVTGHFGRWMKRRVQTDRLKTAAKVELTNGKGSDTHITNLSVTPCLIMKGFSTWWSSPFVICPKREPQKQFSIDRLSCGNRICRMVNWMKEYHNAVKDVYTWQSKTWLISQETFITHDIESPTREAITPAFCSGHLGFKPWSRDLIFSEVVVIYLSTSKKSRTS